MKHSYESPKESASRAEIRVLGFTASCALLLLGFSSCKKRPTHTTPSLPDLSNCTRIEIKYYPSTFRAWFLEGEEVILSPEEKQYLQSQEKFVVDDPERLEEFVRSLSRGRYTGTGIFRSVQHTADVVCYRNGERSTSFADYGSFIITEERHLFDYDKRLVGVSDLTPQLRPFGLRASCARHILACRWDLFFLERDGKKYPPSKWCDVIIRANEGPHLKKKELAADFKCPSAERGKCHYALNPDCEPNSPPDTVRLFETKAGWNQHGGPELFTFDNHDPKGGCVLLNDGTVKFIRTEEELRQLRWE